MFELRGSRPLWRAARDSLAVSVSDRARGRIGTGDTGPASASAWRCSRAMTCGVAITSGVLPRAVRLRRCSSCSGDGVNLHDRTPRGECRRQLLVSSSFCVAFSSDISRSRWGWEDAASRGPSSEPSECALILPSASATELAGLHTTPSLSIRSSLRSPERRYLKRNGSTHYKLVAIGRLVSSHPLPCKTHLNGSKWLIQNESFKFDPFR